MGGVGGEGIAQSFKTSTLVFAVIVGFQIQSRREGTRARSTPRQEAVCGFGK